MISAEKSKIRSGSVGLSTGLPELQTWDSGVSIGSKGTMTESLLSQADAWGFVCQCPVDSNWQIIPKNPTENWQLQLVDSRWLLVVSGVDQISLLPEEAQAFLDRCRTGFKKIGYKGRISHIGVAHSRDDA